MRAHQTAVICSPHLPAAAVAAAHHFVHRCMRRRGIAAQFNDECMWHLYDILLFSGLVEHISTIAALPSRRKF
jgi:hypothetical protein